MVIINDINRYTVILKKKKKEKDEEKHTKELNTRNKLKMINITHNTTS